METNVFEKRPAKNTWPVVVVSPTAHAKLRELASPNCNMRELASLILEDGLSKLERSTARERTLTG